MVVRRFGRSIGPWLYGVAFAVGLPALLVWWAAASRDAVPLPTLPYPGAGIPVAGAGALLMLFGVGSLWVHGRGLPMSPYPPPVYVARGIYRYLAHPIYVGFALLCFGLAVYAQSPSGVWLVAPAVALGCVALVLGFERHELRRRFGAGAIRRPRLALPPPSTDPPTHWDRVSIVLLVFLPWSVAFEAVYRLGVPPDAVEAYLPFERGWPVLQWTEAVYGSVYLFVIGTVFVARTQAALRRLALNALIATAVVTLIYLTVPLIAPPRPFEPSSLLGRALMVERAMSHTVAAFPAFHVVWSLIAAEAWSSRSRAAAIVGWTWAALITVSCLTTGMHALADIAAAVAVFLVLRRYRAVWELLRRVTERMANSWRAWQVGKVRIINYAAYPAVGGAVGFMLGAGLAGPRAFWPLVAVHFAGLIGAGLWAQSLEGSSKLSRPFGYYGSVLAAIGTTIVVGALVGNTTLLLAAIAIEAPWIQAIGRLRCLVQGCCHGHQAPEALGIRYWDERSRVCALGDLRGVPLHPTPLYSILTNVVIGVLLLRLWSLGASLSLIPGVYLILGGVARFVEESYRGEPQTLIVWGLRLYQWLAILSFVGGIVLTTLPAAGAPGLAVSFDPRIAVAALLFALSAGFAMGVDFPTATGRFTRLAPP